MCPRCRPRSPSDHSLKRALGPVNLILLGIGAIIGAGHLRADGTGGRPVRRPGDRALVHARRDSRCALRRTLLRRVRGDDPDRRHRLHLRLRDAGRVHRLDHRVGPDPRVPLRAPRPSRSAGRATSCRSSRTSASTSRPRSPRRPTSIPRRPTRDSTSGGSSPRGGPPPARVLNVPAMFIVALITILLVIGISESAHVQQHHRRHQGDDRAARSSRFGIGVHQRRQLDAVHPAHRRARASSAGTASCAARA